MNGNKPLMFKFPTNTSVREIKSFKEKWTKANKETDFIILNKDIEVVNDNSKKPVLFTLMAGKGTRLDPLTREYRKEELLVAGKPIWLNCYYNILSTFGVGNFFAYDNRGDQPKGSAYSLNKHKKLLQIFDEIVISYGDVVSNINMKKVFERHRIMNADITFVVHKNDAPGTNKGVLQYFEQDKLTSFPKCEFKETENSKDTDFVWSGIMITNNKIFKYSRGKSDLGKEVLPELCKNLNVSIYFHNGFIQDCGTLEGYFNAIKNREKLL